jgi:hypothetical protein
MDTFSGKELLTVLQKIFIEVALFSYEITERLDIIHRLTFY